MLKIVLGVIAGFVAWSILWVGSDQVLMMVSPAWYGAHQLHFALAMANQAAFDADTTVLITHVVRSIIISIISGFLAAFVAGENRRAPLILGVLLLLFGLMVEAMVWSYLPVWYHLIFLALLVPMAMLGGKLKQVPAMR